MGTFPGIADKPNSDTRKLIGGTPNQDTLAFFSIFLI